MASEQSNVGVENEPQWINKKRPRRNNGKQIEKYFSEDSNDPIEDDDDDFMDSQKQKTPPRSPKKQKKSVIDITKEPVDSQKPSANGQKPLSVIQPKKGTPNTSSSKNSKNSNAKNSSTTSPKNSPRKKAKLDIVPVKSLQTSIVNESSNSNLPDSGSRDSTEAPVPEKKVIHPFFKQVQERIEAKQQKKEVEVVPPEPVVEEKKPLELSAVCPLFLTKDQKKQLKKEQDYQQLINEIQETKKWNQEISDGKQPHPFLLPKAVPDTPQSPESPSMTAKSTPLPVMCPVFPPIPLVEQLDTDASIPAEFKKIYNDYDPSTLEDYVSFRPSSRHKLRTNTSNLVATTSYDHKALCWCYQDITNKPTRISLIDSDQMIPASEEKPIGPHFAQVPMGEFLKKLMEVHELSAELLQSLLNEFYSRRQKSINSGVSELWIERYRPTKAGETVGNTDTVKRLFDWFTKWSTLSKFGSGPPVPAVTTRSRSRNPTNTPPPITMSDLGNCVVISGPPGVGKSAAILAIASECGFKILEVNGSAKRAGKQVLELVGEATQSHKLKTVSVSSTENMDSNTEANMETSDSDSFDDSPAPTTAPVVLAKTPSTTDVSSASASLVVFEETDIAYEDDSGFMKALKTLIGISKRPLLLLCNVITPKLQSLMNDFDLLHLHFDHPPTKDLVLYLQLVALTEGWATDYVDVEKLVKHVRCDTRQALLTLQYWCQAPGMDTATLAPIDVQIATDRSDPIPLATLFYEALGYSDILHRNNSSLSSFVQQKIKNQEDKFLFGLHTSFIHEDLIFYNYLNVLAHKIPEELLLNKKNSQEIEKIPDSTITDNNTATSSNTQTPNPSPVKSNPSPTVSPNQKISPKPGGLKLKPPSPKDSTPVETVVPVLIPPKPVSPPRRRKQKLTPEDLTAKALLDEISNLSDRLSTLDTLNLTHVADYYDGCKDVSEENFGDGLQQHIISSIDLFSFQETLKNINNILPSSSSSSDAEIEVPTTSKTKEVCKKPDSISSILERIIPAPYCHTKAAIDYIPFLQSMCESEELRKTQKRRFRHYIASLVDNPLDAQAVMDFSLLRQTCYQ